MTKSQKNEMFWLFEDNMPFYLAKQLLGLENSEQEFDARLTWQRWTRELEDWGFYSY